MGDRPKGFVTRRVAGWKFSYNQNELFHSKRLFTARLV
jgi:hypothetical protein